MAKKNNNAKANTQRQAADAKETIKDMANRIMESGEQIWRAGLGAFAKAQEEGGKLYEALVKEGSALEKITSKYTTGKVEEVRGAVESTVNQVKDRASDTWDKLEKVFEDRVSRALGALGIPGRDELNDLTKKVDDLAKAVKGFTKSAPATAPKAAPKAAAKAASKPAVKVAAKVVAKAKTAPAKAVAKAAAKPVAKIAKKAVAQVKAAVKNVAEKVVVAATETKAE